MMKSNLFMKSSLALFSLLLLLSLVACADKEAKRKTAVDSGTSSERHIVAGETVGLILLPGEPTAGSDIKAVITGSIGSEEVSYSWRVDGKRVEGAGEEVLRSSNFLKGQLVSVTAVVGTEVLSGSTYISNSPPEVESVSLSPDLIYAGVDVTVKVNATDADNDRVDYDATWFVNGAEVVTVRSNVLEGRQFHRGDEISVEVVPYDTEAEGAVYAPLPVTVPNGPPGFTSLPEESFKAQQYRYRVKAVDPDGDKVTYRLEAGPDGMTVSDDGLVLWSIGVTGVGTHGIELVAADPYGAEAYQKYDLTIEIR